MAPGTMWTGSPVAVIDSEILRGVSISLRTCEGSTEGRRFLVIKNAPGSSATAAIVVVQNWVEELKRLEPIRR